ncbi:hypothetical protein SELMODRAFT_78109 [Selaginella moellendorffii]|uniref:3-dehydrosphinganine reductase n=1 Tax=Selaginella moellendorffii TaxID=88036 RepID=D8QV40_SELML|nr:3-dehydrosphinganine reductase TSC10A isoform X1 [Selaginella moellendorffii]EFJ36401.1 hypothetical protein SELMODRAFT_78109 [Selaginella moellendorffii]|eukprot:XP_024515227.1 3-dehydrosphinganine reductase TSC10A isoform X1 [Selaginella moellendorffii]
MVFVLAILLLLPIVLLALWVLKVPSSPVEIRGRHILISGGSSGIGLELAKIAAAHGARKVTLLARNVERLKEARDAVAAAVSGSSDTEVGFVSADVLDRAGLRRAMVEAGDVDVLVCSHGISIPCAFEDARDEDLDTVVGINFMGTMNVIKAALPGMVRDGGVYPRSIAIFSSQAAQAGIYGFACYSGAKVALVKFAESLKQELFLRKIQISVIYPPDTDTPGLREENKFKPEITKILSESSSAMVAIDVARKAMDGIRAGRFNVSCNFDGHLLAILCTGMSPHMSVCYTLAEIVFLPVTRIISLFIQYGWYRTIRAWLIKHKKCV